MNLICSEGVFRGAPGLSVTLLGWLLVSNEDLPSRYALNILRSTLAKEDRVLGLISLAGQCVVGITTLVGNRL